MLAHQDVVVGAFAVLGDAPERVAVLLARKLLASRARPVGRRDLQHEPLAVLVPGEHALGMRPGRLAERRALAGRDVGIVVELVVPQNVEVLAVVDLVEGGAERVARRVAEAELAFLQRLLAGREHVLLAERLVLLHLAAERTRALRGPRARRKGLGVELEGEPPIDRLSGFFQQRRRSVRRVADGVAAARDERERQHKGEAEPAEDTRYHGNPLYSLTLVAGRGYILP